MQKMRCISCGFIIIKEALHDPNVCKDCEDLMIDAEEQYLYPDNII